jgi:hypothetical protein
MAKACWLLLVVPSLALNAAADAAGAAICCWLTRRECTREAVWQTPQSASHTMWECLRSALPTSPSM